MQPAADEGPFDPRQYLAIVRRRMWLIVVVVLVVAGTTYAVSNAQTPVYRTSADLVIQTQQTRSVFDPNSGVARDPLRAVQTELQVIQGQAVRDAVVEDIPEPAAVTAGVVGLTDVVRISAQSTDPELAARTANAYAEAYIDHRRRQAVDNLLTASEQIQDKLAELDEAITDIEAEVAAIGEGDTEASEVRRDALIGQQALFRQRLDELQVDASLQDAGAELVSSAGVPIEPVSPRPGRNAALAGVVALFGTVALAFVLERLDESVRTVDDVSATVPGLGVLAVLPWVPGWRDRSQTQLVTVTEPTSAASEAYRSLRTSILFMSVDRPTTVVQLTSPDAGEGKSTTVANLAVTLAEAGKRVAVVCCDLRRPRVHEFFGLDNAVGFTSVLLGDVALSEALRDLPEIQGVVLLSSGPPPPNPSELLASQSAADVIAQLRSSVDVVLIDSPPVLPVTDAAVVAAHADVTVLVGVVGATMRSHLRQAVHELHQVGAPVAGVVLNGAKAGTGHQYSYEADDVRRPRLRWRLPRRARRRGPR